ncbi:metal-dependent hydrolase [Mycobacteroides franklinii]|uniref:Metal-dependent hydrolase n=1 Tax=Mycobacteroides franklinii TaxID=948102 RepID=A0A4R5PBP2_9MYCO|nr:metal-dependent hydrolase [Mycobacteroides franklinii]ORA61368.1 metal-dependent hydrolase [Mycobacteroides franklinii]TDH22061.1 metal-dependent hydrolase [Mycobacteroides franklinii]
MVSPAAVYPKTRRIRFRFGDDGKAHKYFVEDDIVYSHFVAGLSGGFPPGEEGFIRSVRKFSDQITDPVLKKRVAGFIGQESVHGQEHRRVNEKLVEMGYPIAWWDSKKQVDRLIRFENMLPPRAHLAFTAMAEHMTAILAERTLGSEEVQAIPGDPEVWHLLNWHALEELEHKSVAFDVYRAVGGTETMRIGLMLVAMTIVPPLTLGILAGSLLSDPVARRQPRRLLREARGLFGGPLFKGILSDVRQYLRPGFHPDDINTGELLDRWQQELFGSKGILVDHLK